MAAEAGSEAYNIYVQMLQEALAVSTSRGPLFTSSIEIALKQVTDPVTIRRAKEDKANAESHRQAAQDIIVAELPQKIAEARAEPDGLERARKLSQLMAATIGIFTNVPGLGELMKEARAAALTAIGRPGDKNSIYADLAHAYAIQGDAEKALEMIGRIDGDPARKMSMHAVVLDVLPYVSAQARQALADQARQASRISPTTMLPRALEAMSYLGVRIPEGINLSAEQQAFLQCGILRRRLHTTGTLPIDDIAEMLSALDDPEKRSAPEGLALGRVVASSSFVALARGLPVDEQEALLRTMSDYRDYPEELAPNDAIDADERHRLQARDVLILKGQLNIVRDMSDDERIRWELMKQLFSVLANRGDGTRYDSKGKPLPHERYNRYNLPLDYPDAVRSGLLDDAIAMSLFDPELTGFFAHRREEYGDQFDQERLLVAGTVCGEIYLAMDDYKQADHLIRHPQPHDQRSYRAISLDCPTFRAAERVLIDHQTPHAPQNHLVYLRPSDPGHRPYPEGDIMGFDLAVRDERKNWE